MENIMVARKWSGLEWGARQQGKSLQEAIEDENHLGMDTAIVSSHFRQMEALDYFFDHYGGALGNPQLLVGDDLDQAVVDQAGLVIVLSGDEYYKHVSHFIAGQLTLGVNNDTEKSTAAFAGLNVKTFASFLPRLLNGDFKTAEWIRLQASVNSGPVLPIKGISEVSITALDPNDMNRYELSAPAGREAHKGSGLLVATAYGMHKHAWAKNESQYLANRPECYDLDVGPKQAIFVTRAADLDDHHLLAGKINPGQHVGVTWLAHGEGGIKIDSKHGDPFLAMFTRGGKIKVEIADKPLKVVLPN